MVHLGLGNFHGAHAAVYTAQALAAEPGEWGIHGFANRSHDVVTAMRAQDGRYSVLELSERGRRAAVVDVHHGLGVLHPGDAPGLGVELDEEAASAYQYTAAYLPVNRLQDGTVHDW